VEGGGGVEAAGEGDADFLAEGRVSRITDIVWFFLKCKSKSVDAKFAMVLRESAQSRTSNSNDKYRDPTPFGFAQGSG
jgi:hypothetical protein